MAFCQACGGENNEGARFCNHCGARIAQAGEPAGPLAAAGRGAAEGRSLEGGAQAAARDGGTGPLAPSPARESSSTLSGVTLSGIGVVSPARAGASLALFALLFVGLGVGLTLWLSGGAEPEADALVDAGEPVAALDPPPPPAPLPEGVDPPPAPPSSGHTGGAHDPTHRPSPAHGAGATAGAGILAVAEATGGGAGSGSASATGGTGAARPETTPGAAAGAGGAGPAPSGRGTPATPDSVTSDTTASGDSTSAGGAGGASAPTPSAGGTDWAALEATTGDSPVDHGLDLYLSNVRRFISSHYASQVRDCFSHASAASGSAVRGRVVVGLTIAGDGNTEGVHLVQNTTNNAMLGNCAVNRVDSWRLPDPPNREPVDLDLPFGS